MYVCMPVFLSSQHHPPLTRATPIHRNAPVVFAAAAAAFFLCDFLSRQHYINQGLEDTQVQVPNGKFPTIGFKKVRTRCCCRCCCLCCRSHSKEAWYHISCTLASGSCFSRWSLLYMKRAARLMGVYQEGAYVLVCSLVAPRALAPSAVKFRWSGIGLD